MLTAAAIVLPAAAVEEAKAYLRIVGGDEDALVARLIAGAAELCEQFTRQVLIARSFSQTLPASATWQRLGAAPVRAITGVDGLSSEGAALPVPAGSHSVDIDAGGYGWVRLTQPIDHPRLRVVFEAGMASEWAELPEALRQGCVRLAAHFYMHRGNAEDREPPAAVAALWRPWRRMRLR